MELKIVEKDGKNQFDTRIVERNSHQYHIECEGLRSALVRSEKERESAERILEIMQALPASWRDTTAAEKYYFCTKDGALAVLEEFVPRGMNVQGAQVIPFKEVKMVQCPGCPKILPLIICNVRPASICRGGTEELVICGNTVHVLSRKFDT